MGMVVKNNLSAINTLNVLNKNASDLQKNLQKVSSGMRINSAKDDASGYAISERMRVQCRGLEQDIRNTQNARSLMNTAEGAVESTVQILRTFKEKALDAANDTNTDVDRATIQKELDQFIQQIDDNALVTFNGKYLLNGSMGGNMAADEQGVIVDFMAYLDDSTLSAKDALDGAINYASGGMFQTWEDLRSRFVADMAGGDLMDLCGINVDNLDTGALTGLDAGGEKEKTAESIVPEETSPYSGEAPGSNATSQINGLTVIWPDQTKRSGSTEEEKKKIEWPADANEAMMKAITTALNGQWLQTCMDLIDETYELNFEEPGTSVKTMKVRFEKDDSSNALAYVTNSDNGSGVTKSLTLTVNMKYYNDLDLNDFNGYDKTSKQTYLDRTIAHELTHALMAANITHFNDLPHCIKEGAAELVHGIDDPKGRKATILALTGSAGSARLDAALKSTQKTEKGDDAYAAGFMVLRYLAHQAANAEPEKRMVFQVGTKANQAIKVGLADMRAEALGLKKESGVTISVATQKKATAAITTIDRAISKALNQQTTIGAVQSRLDFTAANLTTAHENVTASESTIRDADMAKEMTEYTKANVLLQAAQSMLAQANQNSSSVLSLLQ